jgi:hypothetical protein
VDLGWRTGAEREGAGRREPRGGSADGGRGSGEEMPVEVPRVLTVVLVEKMLQFFFSKPRQNKHGNKSEILR